jgi:hypothetical protein
MRARAIKAPLESAIVRAILDYLRLDGRVLAWRQNTGAAKLVGKGGRVRPVRFSQPGAADIQGVITRGPNRGRFIALEVKRPGGVADPHQLAWGAAIEKAGGIYEVVRSVEQVRDVLNAEAGPR